MRILLKRLLLTNRKTNKKTFEFYWAIHFLLPITWFLTYWKDKGRNPKRATIVVFCMDSWNGALIFKRKLTKDKSASAWGGMKYSNTLRHSKGSHERTKATSRNMVSTKFGSVSMTIRWLSSSWNSLYLFTAPMSCVELKKKLNATFEVPINSKKIGRKINQGKEISHPNHKSHAVKNDILKSAAIRIATDATPKLSEYSLSHYLQKR